MQPQNFIGVTLILIGILIAAGLFGDPDILGLVLVLIGLIFIFWKNNTQTENQNFEKGDLMEKTTHTKKTIKIEKTQEDNKDNANIKRKMQVEKKIEIDKDEHKEDE